MLEQTLERPPDHPAERVQVRDELERLHVENERLRTENYRLRAALDAHVTRARSTALFGPMEMTAGTCIGPRRLRRR